MKSLDNEGIPVFEGDSLRGPMGIALYKSPSDKQIYAIVSRKTGSQDGKYLHQYLLSEQEGNIVGKLVREFGKWEGKEDIEALLAVLKVSTRESDGSEITSVPLNEDFPNGLFVAMSTNKTFQLYDWRDLAAADSLKY